MLNFSYTINRTRSRLTGVTIRISLSKGVVVTAPFWVPGKMIEAFVVQKADWIEQSLAKTRISPIKKPTLQDGASHLFFGEALIVKLDISDTVLRTKAEIIENSLLISVHSAHPEDKRQLEIEQAILHLYMEKGIEAITTKVNYYAKLLGVDYSKITIKPASSIWGSCSGRNNLSFNRKLIMAPHKIVDYVVIHEVCHLVHRDHSPRFWRLVGSLVAEYLSHRHWLHKNHQLLTI